MAESSLKTLWESSPLDGGSSAYVESLYESYLDAPENVEDQWRAYFDKLPKKNGAIEVAHSEVKEAFLELAQHSARFYTTTEASPHQIAVNNLVNAYRAHGHQSANLDPLGLTKRPDLPELSLAFHGLDESALQTSFSTGLYIGPETDTLKNILDHLQNIYTGNIGAEFMHITSAEEREWLLKYFEASDLKLMPKVKRRLLERLTAAEGLEHFLHKKYVGQKRFGLEGSDALIPIIDDIILRAGAGGVKEIVLGMPHRGRLNVLVNIMGKFPSELFAEFEGKQDQVGMGDVKYHQGFSADAETEGGYVHLALSFNPSHLEIVSPVVQGSVRARQERRKDDQRDQVLSIVMHGDSAFAGQGVVMETLNMSQTPGYGTGGTLHIVVNNQVGFTTSDPRDTRSTRYCTDVAKMIEAPILHVNGDDPESALWAAQIALDYRMRFKKDVVIDLVSYRRHGHNEADEPMATQPVMYTKIKAHATPRQRYVERLLQEQVVTQAEADSMASEYRQRLDQGQQVTITRHDNKTNEFAVNWQPYLNKDWTELGETRLPQKKLTDLSNALLQLPEGFTLQPQVKNMWQQRKKMAAGEIVMDWGFAENMAYATLLSQGYAVRISGQDCGRGTFSHRHAILHEQKTGEKFCPLQQLSKDQAKFTVIDSLLSEEAVLAFEYGYAVAEPNTLVVWEAQFGDFANGAQVVIDQFITSGEQKWGRLCGMALFLPHGFEGMGAEHSSARLERFLQLSAQHNIQVCVPTTPAQVYHMIRRQMVRVFRRPLIVMSPKSVLRHKKAVSTLEELANGEFQTIIPDTLQTKGVQRVVLCSGRVYYDLLARREEVGDQSVALVRIEQLYPFPEEALTTLLKTYKGLKQVVWAQEEPMNQGAWYCTAHHIRACLPSSLDLTYAGREPAAAPAVGYLAVHVEQQARLVDEALGLVK